MPAVATFASQIQLTASALAPNEAEAHVLVLAATAGDEGASLLPSGLADESVSAIESALRLVDYKAGQDEVLRLPSPAKAGVKAESLLVVGLGKSLELAERKDLDTAVLGENRAGLLARAAGRAARALAGMENATFALPAAEAEDLRAVARGIAAGAYSWAARVPEATTPLAAATILTAATDTDVILREAEVLAAGTRVARDLINEPPIRLTPAVFADYAVAAASERGIETEVWDEQRLEAEGFGGIIGVGQGSVHPPRLVRLSWKPQNATAHLAVVGKGITFDSGGLSLKPPASMPEMKSDMAGAATTLGAVLAAASLQLNTRVDGWLALAENMPGGGAQRPSDIITMYGGTTVEITNTDAEGRLVMADALARAVEEEPDALIDIATLTGAQIIALGNHVSGVMGTPKLRERIAALGAGEGEAFWPMPLPERLDEVLSSPVATLRNAAVGYRAGGMLSAGLFLRHFVNERPWAHLDVAGPAFNDKAAWGGTPAGGTGAGLLTLVALMRSLSDESL